MHLKSFVPRGPGIIPPSTFQTQTVQSSKKPRRVRQQAGRTHFLQTGLCHCAAALVPTTKPSACVFPTTQRLLFRTFQQADRSEGSDPKKSARLRNAQAAIAAKIHQSSCRTGGNLEPLTKPIRGRRAPQKRFRNWPQPERFLWT